MATVDLVMPKMGESIMEATILKWHKNPGDPVNMDETVLEIATDKVDSEVPSTASGVIDSILFQVNDVVPIGTVIAKIRTGGEQKNTEQARPDDSVRRGITNVEVKEEVGPSMGTTPSGNANPDSYQPDIREEKTSTGGNQPENRPDSYRDPKSQTSSNKFYSPLVLNIAAREGVSMSELESIEGNGNEGRVTKTDILQYIDDKRAGKTGNSQSATKQDMIIPASRVESSQQAGNGMEMQSYKGNVEIIEMDRMRKLIADHMVRSKHTSPHVTSFTEADVTNLVMWRNRVKKEFEKRENTRITFTPLFIEAIVRCIKKFPLINSSLDGNRIIVKKDINIGMATALPSGNLIVPVIKNADQLNLVGLSKQVNAMADSARSNKLKPEDISDGTFTLTNVGTFGSLMGTPIINQPQVAILAVGAIKKRPVVVETPHGDSIAIRHMMYLSMSYDHRIVDGSLGATFLTAVANELENFNGEREF
jgi:2-oxoglutarate dehydrogenase E2 component (dihydrolipoamide succinyltransferase)